jgi:hypothetical protein
MHRHLTYANVMSTLAVFGVLAGGGAWAASKIGTHEIENGAVTAKKLHRQAVTTRKIKDGAVNGAKVRDDSLTGADISASTLGTVPKATNANTLGDPAQPASAFQQRITGTCSRPLSISSIGSNGTVNCDSAVFPIDQLLTPGQQEFQLVGASHLVVGPYCETIANGTKILFENSGPNAGTLNWIYSDGTTVHAGGDTIGGGNSDPKTFDFSGTNARLEGQWIFWDPADTVTVNLHAFHGGGICEERGTAEIAPNS